MEEINKQILRSQNKIKEISLNISEEKLNDKLLKLTNELAIENKILETLINIKENSLINKNIDENHNIKKINVSKNLTDDKIEDYINEDGNNVEDNIINKSKYKKNKKNNKSSNNIKEILNNEHNTSKRSKTNDKFVKDKKELIQIENFDPNKESNFYIYFKDTDIYSKYITKIKKQNYIYYDCSKRRNGCKGSIVYNKTDKKFYKKRDCSENIKHDTSKFEKFYEDYNKNNLKNYNMNYEKIQKFYVRSLFKANECIDINTIHSNFKNSFNVPLKLTNHQIYNEKYIALGTNKNLDLFEICKKLSNEKLKVNLKSIDIFYDIKNKDNKTTKKEEKVIIITTDIMENNLKSNNLTNYFLDVTYRIIPKIHHNYKLLTISGINPLISPYRFKDQAYVTTLSLGMEYIWRSSKG